MDKHELLERGFLRHCWRASPRWHGLLAAKLAIPSFLHDELAGGAFGMRRLTARLQKELEGFPREWATPWFRYRQHYHAMRSLYNYGWLINSDVERIRARLAEAPLHGREHVRAALASGHGVVAFSAHVGCFFNLFFAPEVARLCRGRSVLLLTPGISVNRKRRLQEQLARAHPEVAWQLVDLTSRSTGTKVFRALKDGQIVACALDYAFPFTKNVVVRFLGGDVEFPVGLVEIGRRIPVTFLPSFSYVRDGGVVLEFEEPFQPAWSDDAGADVAATVARINRAIEAKVQQVPTQWGLWFRFARPTP